MGALLGRIYNTSASYLLLWGHCWAGVTTPPPRICCCGGIAGQELQHLRLVAAAVGGIAGQESQHLRLVSAAVGGIVGQEFKQTNNNDLLEKYGGTKNCIYKD